MAVIRVEALEQGVEADAESSFEPVEPEAPVEPDELLEPVVPLEPAAPPVEPSEVEPSWSVSPAPVEFPPPVLAEGVVEAVDADPADAPSSWVPSPLSQAVSVSVAAVSAAATSMRVRLARMDM
ncbi:hypothetical protein GCM10023080_018710 [Streptomyces pseudoechinosporeus]